MFYLYLLICYITWPVRKLLFWWPYADVDFAIRLLFWNRYKHSFVFSQAKLETGNFTSGRYRDHNNCFGMGSNTRGYQKGVNSSNGASGEPNNFASYSTVYHSVFDYYQRNYKSFPSVGATINAVPQTPFSNDAPADTQYIYKVCTALKNSGYFTAPLASYYNAVTNFVATSKDTRGYTVFNCIGGVLAIVYFARLFYYRLVHKKKVPKIKLKLLRLGY